MFCEESLDKINAKDVKLFQNWLVHEFYCLKVRVQNNSQPMDNVQTD